jgi:radical SAM protein with 4Fe4S-binding SPASM domain
MQNILYDKSLKNNMRKRFIFRQDLNLLYDKKYRITHLLDEIGSYFIKTLLISNNINKSIDSICNLFSVDKTLIYNDINEFALNILNYNENEINVTPRGGTPEWAIDKTPDFPLSIEIELTKYCNWNCEFCYNTWKYTGNIESNIPYLSVECFENIVSEASSNGVFTIRLSGGEPTLHPNFEEILKIASRKNMDITLFTNGHNLTISKIEFMKENGVNQLLFSLHGISSIHNKLANSEIAFEEAVNAIKLAYNENMDFSVETTLTSENISQLIDLAMLLNKLHVKHWNIMPYVQTIDDVKSSTNNMSISYIELNNALKNIKKLYKNFDIRIPCSPKHCFGNYDNNSLLDISYDNHCGAGILWASISYDGRIRHCPHSDCYAGNISDGIKNIWQEKIFPKVSNVLKPKAKCKQCNLFNSCKMGCHLYEVKDYD